MLSSQKLHQLSKPFGKLFMKFITNKTLLEDDMDSYFENAKNWVNLFTSLCDKKIKQM